MAEGKGAKNKSPQTPPAPVVDEKGLKENSDKFWVGLSSLCEMSTPLMKRVPNSLRNMFYGNWGTLLTTAVYTGKEHDWCKWAMYPRAILWTLERGGHRFSKRIRFADIVRKRMTRWTNDRENLWKEVVKRSSRPAPAQDAKKFERDGPAHREGSPGSSVSGRCAQSSATAQEHAYRSEGGCHVQEATTLEEITLPPSRESATRSYIRRHTSRSTSFAVH